VREQEVTVMDYKAAGAPKLGKNAPKHIEHNAHGTKKKPFGQRPSKEELLARMKAAAEAKKAK
jgi:hypothetical protein